MLKVLHDDEITLDHSMQEPDEQGYLMHLWHGNAGAEQLNVTVRLEFPIRIRRRSGNTPTEVKRRDENLLGAI